MKKILIVILLTMFSAIIINQFKTVEALTVPFDISFNSPRFTYLYDESDDINELDMVYSYTLNYYDETPVTSPIILEQIDVEGNFIKRLQYTGTIFQRDDDYIEFTSLIEVTVTSEDYTTEFDLKDYITGEIISVNFAMDDDGVLFNDYDVNYNESSGILKILPFETILNDTIFVSVTYFQGNNYQFNYVYGWEDVLWSDDEIIYYRLMYKEIILISGAVLLNRPPEDINNPNNVESVEVGNFYLNGNEPDFTDQTGFTYSKITDDYLIMFYELVEGETYSPINTEFNYVFTDISNNTVEYTFNSSDLIYFQAMTYDLAYDIPELLRVGFIMINLNGEEGFLKVDLPLINDRLLTNDFDVGSYILSAYDYDLTTLKDVSEVVINITDSQLNPFELDVVYDDVILGGNQVIQFKKNDIIINGNYNTTSSGDPSIGYDYSEYINNTSTTYGITYETIEEILTIFPYWTVEPNNLPYSLDTGDYAITFNTSYNVVDNLNTEGQINNLLINSSFNSDLGRIFISLVIFLILNISISSIAFMRSPISYIVVNASLIFMFSYLGFIPIWVSLGIGVLLSLMMLLIFNRTEVQQV